MHKHTNNIWSSILILFRCYPRQHGSGPALDGYWCKNLDSDMIHRLNHPWIYTLRWALGRFRYLGIRGGQIISDRRFNTGGSWARHRADIGQSDMGSMTRRRPPDHRPISKVAPTDNFRPNIPGSRRTPGRVPSFAAIGRDAPHFTRVIRLRGPKASGISQGQVVIYTHQYWARTPAR